MDPGFTPPDTLPWGEHDTMRPDIEIECEVQAVAHPYFDSPENSPRTMEGKDGFVGGVDLELGQYGPGVFFVNRGASILLTPQQAAMFSVGERVVLVIKGRE